MPNPRAASHRTALATLPRRGDRIGADPGAASGGLGVSIIDWMYRCAGLSVRDRREQGAQPNQAARRGASGRLHATLMPFYDAPAILGQGRLVAAAAGFWHRRCTIRGTSFGTRVDVDPHERACHV